MGMTQADLCVYLAFATLATMFVVRSAVIDTALALCTIALAVAACCRGMKSDPEFEDITNLFKAITYPAAFLFVVLVIAVHYLLIMNGCADCAGYGVSRAVEGINHFFRNPPRKM